MIAITSSADGTKLAAVVYSGQIYTSSTPFPESIISVLTTTVSSNTVWSPYVLWGQSETCEYSFDNWNTTSVADCSLNGVDILEPLRGTS